MDGPTATKKIRSLGFSSPIFGVTGNLMDQDVERFKTSGADVVLGKPFDMKAFESFMRK
jgi:CheY-like chemotaxis protein